MPKIAASRFEAWEKPAGASTASFNFTPAIANGAVSEYNCRLSTRQPAPGIGSELYLITVGINAIFGGSDGELSNLLRPARRMPGRAGAFDNPQIHRGFPGSPFLNDYA
jgi:hypothetical protein